MTTDVVALVSKNCGRFGFFLVWQSMAWYGMVWSLWFLRQRTKARTRLPTAVHLIFAHFQIFPILKLARAKFAGTLSIVYFVSVEDCKSCLPAAFVDVSPSLVILRRRFLVRGH